MTTKYYLTINIDDIRDAITLNQDTFYDEIWRYAEVAVKSGGQVVIQQEYSNAAPDIIVTISDVAQLLGLKTKYDKNRRDYVYAHLEHPVKIRSDWERIKERFNQATIQTGFLAVAGHRIDVQAAERCIVEEVAAAAG